MLRLIKKIIPKPLFRLLQPAYHKSLAFTGALLYRFPSKKLIVIGVTGTKGKSSTSEIIYSILESAGHKVALASTIHFKIGKYIERNLFKMTMPGRFFLQRFLRRAKNEGATHVIIEMTSEGVKQFRHKFIDLDALVFTNLSHEHIESHGSFENYKKAKLKLRDALESSSKKKKFMIANHDDEHGKDFLDVSSSEKVPFSLREIGKVVEYPEISFTYKDAEYYSPLKGLFNVYNIFGAIKATEVFGVDTKARQKGVEHLDVIRGRVEHIFEGQPFTVVVDYAHTPDSLEKLYRTFGDKEKVCVLGNTGGGRDTWKRPEMAQIAEKHCSHVILTDEDPYDEDPKKIVEEMAAGMKKEPEIIMNRREAIRTAFKRVSDDGVVLITGKGTDPYIMRANGKKEPWSDADVAREELRYILGK